MFNNRPESVLEILPHKIQHDNKKEGRLVKSTFYPQCQHIFSKK